MQRGQHLLAQVVDVVLAAPGVFRRQGVGAQKGGAHRDALLAPQAARHAQLFALMLQGQAVAGLDFDGAHALGHQRLQAWQGAGVERVFAGRTRGTHAGDDAAPGAGHFLVAGARQAQGKFMRALATIDQVGVAINQPRRGPGAARIVLRQVRKRCGQGLLRPQPAQHALLHHHRSRCAVGHGLRGLRQAGGQAQVAPHTVGAGGWGLGHGLLLFL